MCKKPVANEKTIQDFINAVYPTNTALSQTMGTEETILQDATKLIASMKDALWAVANMQITETTDKAEVLALCMSIAKIELQKY